jgi:hypothetical protein
VLPVQFPASQTYFFNPLNEHVAVYQKPFTLVQEVILEGTQQAQAALRGKEKQRQLDSPARRFVTADAFQGDRRADSRLHGWSAG